MREQTTPQYLELFVNQFENIRHERIDKRSIKKRTNLRIHGSMNTANCLESGAYKPIAISTIFVAARASCSSKFGRRVGPSANSMNDLDPNACLR
jgi:hypothetical protein